MSNVSCQSTVCKVCIIYNCCSRFFFGDKFMIAVVSNQNVRLKIVDIKLGKFKVSVSSRYSVSFERKIKMGPPYVSDLPQPLAIDSVVGLSDGNSMPLFGLGTYELSNSEAYESSKNALENGYKLIDTAALYKVQNQCH